MTAVPKMGRYNRKGNECISEGEKDGKTTKGSVTQVYRLR